MGETTPQTSDEHMSTPLVRDYTPNVYLAQAYTTLVGGNTPQTCDIQMLYPPNVLPNPDGQQTVCQNSKPFDIVRLDHEMRFYHVSTWRKLNQGNDLGKNKLFHLPTSVEWSVEREE